MQLIEKLIRFNIKSAFVLSFIFFICFYLISLDNNLLLINIILFFSIIFLIVFSDNLLSKIVSVYYLIIYYFPYFVFDSYNLINKNELLKLHNIIFFFIGFIFLFEFIYKIFTKSNISVDIKLNKGFILSSILYLNILFLAFISLILLIDILSNNFIYENSRWDPKIYNYIHNISIIGQILKKIYYVSIINLFIIVVFDLNKKFFYLIFTLFIFISIIMTSRSSTMMSLFALMLFFSKKNFFNLILIIIISPIILNILALIRRGYAITADINNGIINFISFKQGMKIVLDQELFPLHVFIFNSFERLYSRINFAYELCMIYFSNSLSTINKYYLNIQAIFPRKIIENKNIIPFSDDETRRLGLNNENDFISTVSLHHLPESLYILGPNYLIIPIIMGAIFLIHKKLFDFNMYFYFSSSLFFCLLIISKESFTAISPDILFYFFVLIIFKYLLFYKISIFQLKKYNK